MKQFNLIPLVLIADFSIYIADDIQDHCTNKLLNLQINIPLSSLKYSVTLTAIEVNKFSLATNDQIPFVDLDHVGDLYYSDLYCVH